MLEVRIEVASRSGARDPRGEHMLAHLRSAGVVGVEAVEARDLYFLRGEHLTLAEVERLATALLVDPIEQVVHPSERLRSRASWTPGQLPQPKDEATHRIHSLFRLRKHDGSEIARDFKEIRVEVAPLPGVTDSAGENLLAAAHALGITALEQAGAGRVWVLKGQPTSHIPLELFGNSVVESIRQNASVPAPYALGSALDLTVEVEPIRALSDTELRALGTRRRLALDLAELAAIRTHYQGLGRDPTDAELEMLAQTWSEHCVHKTFKARIEYHEAGQPLEVIEGLFNQYIKAATLKTQTDWLRSVFVDNAGVVGFDDALDLAFKVETHNHPSAIDPFGGANTGVGGVIRDVMGVSARPIACTDVLCFGPPEHSAPLPSGVLHPARIAAGVVAGVGDYGNKMGIPTVNGAVLYDPGYVANPLVFCGCLGVVPRGAHPRRPQVGDRVVVLGGRTGRDGLRGATFSSMEMGADTASVAGSSVQIGHPIHQKQVLEVVIAARDARLYTAITDCGAGGLSSAVGEMAAELGARVDLAQVPLKYPGLRPWEVWLSEAQERMVMAVPPGHLPALAALCELHGVEWADLGYFTGEGHLDLRHGDVQVVDLTMNFLHEGLPRRQLVATWAPPAHDPHPPASTDIVGDLLALLATPDIRSKEGIVRGYDHEVQGGTVVRPFVGPEHIGPSDAAVLRPFGADASHRRAVALSVGIQPHIADPYAMAWAAVDEAFRNLVAVGGDPGQTALLDNFCWGSPTRPATLGALVRCARGCHDAAVAWGAPFISGKDSLNNEYLGEDGQRHAIPGTLLISALAIVPDLRQALTLDLKAPGDLLYVVGITGAETGGGAWARLRRGGGSWPAPNPAGVAWLQALHRAIRAGLVRSAHDCAEGGLALALAEMALAGGLGLEADLGMAPGAGELAFATAAFSESPTRLVVAVSPENSGAFEAEMAGVPCARIGQVRADTQVVLAHTTTRVAVAVADLTQAFRGHLTV